MRSRQEHMTTLYTIQKPDIDITRPPVKIPGDYWRRGGAYYGMAQYLQWLHWIWCLRCINDFENNEWLSFEKPLPMTLWILAIPETLVRWCSLDKHYRKDLPVDQWFYASADRIRREGEIPMGLVASPISCRYVAGTHPVVVSNGDGLIGVKIGDQPMPKKGAARRDDRYLTTESTCRSKAIRTA